jgi:DNA gyrase subunit A
MAVSDLRVMGRATQGVRLINLKEDDGIAAVAKVEVDLEEIDEVDLLDDTETTDFEENGDSAEESETPDPIGEI